MFSRATDGERGRRPAGTKLVYENGPVDVLINNAGYFYGPRESVVDKTLNFEEELRQIDICAVGPLRVTSAMRVFRAGMLL